MSDGKLCSDVNAKTGGQAVAEKDDPRRGLVDRRGWLARADPPAAAAGAGSDRRGAALRSGSAGRLQPA